MFDGGGVPIDHYIIQVDNNTQLETTDLTYQLLVCLSSCRVGCCPCYNHAPVYQHLVHQCMFHRQDCL